MKTLKDRKLNKDKILLFIGIAISIIVFFITMIRSEVSGLNYDEAYTYLHIARYNLLDPKILLALFHGYANNHWLNSFLIFIFDRLTGIHYNEFIIRLPVLLSFAVYLLLSCIGYKKKYYSFTTLLFLIGNYYLNEYYGLARGYGLANTCIFGMCLSYIAWKKSGYSKSRYFNLLLICVLLAGLSNTVILLLYPGIFCICFIKAYKAKTITLTLNKSIVTVAFWILISSLLLYYHFCISSSDKPLYTANSILYSGKNDFFNCFIMGYVNMFLEGSLSTIVSIGIIVLAMISIIVLKKKNLENDLTLITSIFIITCIVMELFLHKGYPVGRVLLPFYSLLVLALSELFGNAFKKIKIKKASIIQIVISTLLCISICYIYACKTDVQKTKEWESHHIHKNLELGRYLTGQEYYEGYPLIEQEFYEEKYNEVSSKYREYLSKNPVHSFNLTD